jgi:L-cysteine:1D-myo-inositol 2-amino-2-deoxy-alpha-D-glucopyranoside ligase
MIGLAGEKMSKSRGNLVLVSRLRADGVPPAAIRLALFAGHYRADRDWTADLLAVAQARLERWRAAVSRPTGPDATGLLAAVRRYLADDLDTPRALAAVDRWAAETLHRGGPHPDAPGLVRDLADALLGIDL